MSMAMSLVRRIRPAPLGWQVGKMLGLAERRILTLSGGTRVWVSPISDLGSALAGGDYEPVTQAVLRKYLRAGDTFIDAGANEGFFTVLGSQLVGAAGKVIAIEPQSRLQEVIRRNIALNGCENAQLIQAGIASQRGSFQLSLASDMNSGGSSIYQTTRYKQPEETVRTITLADLLAEGAVAGCQLMKVDVEGAEYDIFLNAGEILRSGVLRNIALEIHEHILMKQGLDPRKVHDFVVDCGYRLNNDLGHPVYESTVRV
jgi:FkbM family methyltransferase